MLSVPPESRFSRTDFPSCRASIHPCVPLLPRFSPSRAEIEPVRTNSALRNSHSLNATVSERLEKPCEAPGTLTHLCRKVNVSHSPHIIRYTAIGNELYE